MHNPFAPLIAIAPLWHSPHRRRRLGLRSPQCPLPREVSASSPSAPPRPTATTQAAASPSGVAPDAVVAAGCRPGLMPIPAPGPHPCDASCRKSPPDASHNLDPQSQTVEKQELKTSQIKFHPPVQMRHPSGRRILPKTPSRCVSQLQPTPANH
jgi:hypothetical protein